MFTDAAKNAHYSGTVIVAVSLTDTGAIDDLWIEKPEQFGLSDQAAKAVSHYVFKPEVCHGTPVPTMLQVQVNFSIY